MAVQARPTKSNKMLLYCSGGHYYLPPSCEESGYVNPLQDGLLKKAPDTDPSYDLLLKAGLTEEELLQVLVVPVNTVESVVVPCAAVATSELARAVAERNRFVLSRFPCGWLWSKLLNPPALAYKLYARRIDSSTFVLLDMAYGYERDGSRLSDSRKEFWRAALEGRVPAEDFEFRRILVNADRPQLGIDKDLVGDPGDDLQAWGCFPLLRYAELNLTPPAGRAERPSKN